MSARYASIVYVAVILGLLVGLQVKILSVSEPGSPEPGSSPKGAETLTADLKDLNQEIESLKVEVRDLNGKVYTGQQGVQEAEEALQTEIEKYKVFAGRTKVIGPGVEIILENKPGMNFLVPIIHDDLLGAVNELRVAGAEAIAVNGQRIIATSEIRVAGPFINVNLERISPPYRIQALGNPDKLRGELERSEGWAEYHRNLGMSVTIEPKEELVLPEYQSQSGFEFAQLKKEGV